MSKEDRSVVESVLDILRNNNVGQPMHFGFMTPKRGNFDKNLALLSKQSSESSVVAGFATTQSKVTAGYDFLQLEDTSALFEGRIYAPVSKATFITQAAKSPQHCEATLQTLLEEADGDYAFWMLKNGWMAAGRDPMGMQPLYFGENNDITAYATNRAALWKLGIREPKSFPPGTLGSADKNGFKFKPIKTPSYAEPTQVTLDEAAQTLQVLLTEAVRRRVQDLKETAIAFSGGLDSSIIAYLAAKQGTKVSLLHVSLENQPETEQAIEAAEVLDLPMQIHFFKDSDVETALPNVVELIEEPDPIKAAIGVSFYWIAEQATQAKFRTVLAGQGADELFGGYQRYVNQACKNGTEDTRRTMYHDVITMHESNLERDMKITGFHDVELRCPFASYAIAEFALGLPLEYKIEPKTDTLRKLVLRRTARNLGIPAVIVNKPKKAVQYSTGINNAMKRIAKNNTKTIGEYTRELFERSFHLQQKRY
ncbi:MAG: asparagine synthetase B [Nitrososphaerota archaeon]|nr:asparagine synthetase B [Nitrososphaerota archaeon]